jgi:integrase
MDINDIYNLLESHLDNEIDHANKKMKRVKLPIPEEYGGGFATGFGYEEAVKNLIARIRDHLAANYTGPLFSDCWEKWIMLKEGQMKSSATISSYKWLAKRYILPFFGSKHIDEVTADDIQQYFNQIIGLSKSVSTQSKAILSGIFDRAVRLGDIPQNIMLYKYEKSRKTGKKVVLQDDDLIGVIKKLEDLEETGDCRDYLYFCFLCFTALRRGEILALKWGDLDFKKSEINVSRNVIFPNGQNNPVIGEPKDGSCGIVRLQSELARRIEPYVGRPESYILPFSNEEKNKPMTRSMFTKMWNRCKKIIDLKGATSHSFRASYATMMNAHCNHVDPKALQGALRHKTPDLAIKVYTKENVNKTRLAEAEYDEWMKDSLKKHLL